LHTSVAHSRCAEAECARVSAATDQEKTMAHSIGYTNLTLSLLIPAFVSLRPSVSPVLYPLLAMSCPSELTNCETFSFKSFFSCGNWMLSSVLNLHFNLRGTFCFRFGVVGDRSQGQLELAQVFSRESVLRIFP